MNGDRLWPCLLWSAAAVTVLAATASRTHAQGGAAADSAAGAGRLPRTYLAIFMNGYGSDTMPKEDAQFERLLLAITKQGHFNAILCQYSPAREKLCKKHHVLMVVDLLASPHVYKEPQQCEELLGKLRGSPAVAAYHLWSDRFGKQGEGRARDIDNVHQWDPHHATFSGTYDGASLRYLGKSDFVSNYDFSWERGPHKNFRNLLAQWNAAKPHNTRLGRYCEVAPGLPGKGNANRLLYIQTTSIACGLRAACWHIGSRMLDMGGSFALNQVGKDLAAVNAWIEPMREEIARIGLPEAIYSTPWTKDQNDRSVEQKEGKPAMPPALESNAFPAEFWLQPVSGEFVMGISKYDNTDKDVAFIANHNAYAPQDVRIKLTRPVKPRLFSRSPARYESVPVTDGAFRLKLAPAGGAILLFD